jgi:hypothetical protein
MCATSSSRFDPAPPSIKISECQVFKQKLGEMFEDFYAFWFHMTQATKYTI